MFKNLHIINLIKRHSSIIFNFSYLSILQVLNLLIPLITYPYLISIFKQELYGYIVFSQVIASYFAIFIAFGFSTVGIKEISINRNNTNKISEIVSSISLIKSFFLIVSFLVCLGIVMVVDVPFKWLYILSFWSCIGNVIFPVWFFQGIEQMKYITFISVINKLLVLLLIFIFIKTQTDIYLYPLINLFGTLASGGISFYLIYQKGIRLHLQPFATLLGYLRESYHFFITDVFTQVYTNTAKTITGIFLGMREVAYYDLAEKIINIFKIPQTIIVQTLFPRISIEKNIRFIKKVFLGCIVFSLITYLILFLGSEYFVSFLSKGNMPEATHVVRILGLVIVCIAVSSSICFFLMIPFGFKKVFTRLIVFCSLTYIIFVGIFHYTLSINLYTLCISVVLVEFLIALFSLFFIYKNKTIWYALQKK